ncbi:MAG: S49 family peptidase [Alphaproteobacteria bacterium]|nr:S49 family peptidase [Alphaproteobacteria bacterium]
MSGAMVALSDIMPMLGGPRPVVAVVRLAGVIGLPGRFRQSLSMAALAGPLERAFRLRHLRAVALVINSPGGSAVQSALIHRRIRALASERKVPVIAFAEDVAASGGYWLACAADEIYADDSSIIGSIGVISSGFGFVGLLEKLGIERRVHARGDKKSILDPFRPERAEDVDRLDALQREVHQRFQALVRERRGSRLKATEEELFSGEFWTGAGALARGLVDGIGDLRSVMRARFGEEVRLRPVTGDRPWLFRRIGLTAAPDLVGELLGAIEARALWSRFGL